MAMTSVPQLSAAAAMTSVPQLHSPPSSYSPRSMACLPSVRMGRKRSHGIRCDYIGSATNLMHADHGDDDADAVRRLVRAGTVGEPEGDGGRSKRRVLRAADRRPRRVH